MRPLRTPERTIRWVGACGRPVRRLRLRAALAALVAIPCLALACDGRDPDLDDDGVVNLLDLARMKRCFLHAVASDCGCRAADLDADGLVELDDLAILRGAFMTSGWPTPPRDTTPPDLRVEAPADGELVTSDVVRVWGRVDDEDTEVTLDGERVPVRPGSLPTFSARVALREGENALEITATDGACNEARVGRRVVRLGGPAPERGVAAGEVYDAATGRPLSGVRVELVAPDDEPADPPRSAQTDARGRYRLASRPGDVLLHLSREGYTGVWREVPVAAGGRSEPLDAGLAPLGAPVAVSSLVGGRIAAGSGAELEIPPGSLAADAEVSLTALPAHALAVPTPPGFAVLAAAEVGPASLAFAGPAVLELTPPSAPPPPGLVAARLDPVGRVWIALPAPASAEGGGLAISVAAPGQVALLAMDTAPLPPPTPAPGQVLVGVPVAGDPPARVAHLAPAPRLLLADPEALATVEVSLEGAALPSGSPLALEREEALGLLDGGALLGAPFAQDALLQAEREGAGQRARLPVGLTLPFDPLALAEGAIELRARERADPATPSGVALGAAGGSVGGPGGVELRVAPGAVSVETPVAVAAIDPALFAGLLAGGDAEAIAAFAIDLHGGSLAIPAELALGPQAGVGPGEVLVAARLELVLGRSALAAVGLAAARDGGFLVAADPASQGVSLPGLREEGRYALLRLAGGLAFASGTVRDAGGAPLPGAVVRGEGLALAALADADGRFTLPIAAAPRRLVAADPATRDEAAASVSPAPGEIAALDLVVEETPPRVVASDPADGASGVRIASVLRVDFSEPLSPASVGAGALALRLDGAPVAGALDLSPERRSLRFAPQSPLAPDRPYVLRVAPDLADDAGHPIGSEVAIRFTTEDRTRPAAPPPGQVTATIPGIGPGATSTVAAGPGTLEPGGLAVVVNLRTGVATSVTPAGDGGFVATVAASRSDRLELRLRDTSPAAELAGDDLGDDDGVCESGEACGNETRIALGPFRDPDGRTVVGSEGGLVEGAGGVFVEVPAGALPDGTAVLVEPLDVADLALPAPADFPAVAGLRLDLGGVTPLAALDVGVAAPPDARPDDQVLVATDVATPSGPAWTVADRAHLDGGRYVTASPPFPGVIAQGSYAFLRSTLDCVSYVRVDYDLGAEYLLLPNGLPFVAFTTSARVAVLPAVCDRPLEIQVVDGASGEPVLGPARRRAPPARDAVAEPEAPLSDDTRGPVVLGVSTPSGGQPREVEIRFGEPIDPESAQSGFLVQDGSGARVPGRVELREGDRVAVFRPHLPFRIGETYSVVLFGVRDRSGNLVEAAEESFTAFDPGDPLAVLARIPELEALLRKCTAAGACTTSVRTSAHLGDVVFLANGTSRSDERHDTAGEPQRLLAVDVSDPTRPRLVGSHPTATNPLALAVVEDARVTAPDGTPFAGDLLLVAGGGRVAGGELAAKLEVWDVSTCTRPLGLGTTNCLSYATSLRGWKLLSTPSGVPPQPGVPPESGVPLQLEVLHERVPGADDAIAAYAVVSAIGLEAADVAEAFNLETGADRAPDGLRRGDYTDVAVSALRGLVAALEPDPATGGAALELLSPALTGPRRIAVDAPASRLALYENFAVDLDADGNLGRPFEDEDDDEIAADDEFFDLALLGAGPIDHGCAGPPPCGELVIVDVSPETALDHAGAAGILARVPLPKPAFDVQVDAAARLALVELRGAGLAIVDLSFLEALLRPGVQVAEVEAAARGMLDLDADGRDDRLLGVIEKPDVFAGQLGVDAARGLAVVSGTASGPELVRYGERCHDVAVDFQRPPPPPPGADRNPREDTHARLRVERARLQAILARAAATLVAAGISADQIAILEQGSGACFWRAGFPASCDAAFESPRSDHDYEVFVPQHRVEDAQGALDALVRQLRRDRQLEDIGDLSLFAFSRDAFEAAELTIGTPQNDEGDATGDLALGRQTLLLLWILEGEWVPGYEGTPLPVMLDRLRDVRPIPGEPSGIPRLEGYEWSRLQEFNFYKTGAHLRIAGMCERPDFLLLPDADLLDPNDPARQEEDLFGSACDDQVRGVGKAAIRSVMARLVSHRPTNTVLIPESLDAYRAPDACLTGVEDVHAPPTTVAGFTRKRCGSFEEYALSEAIEALAVGSTGGVFEGVGVDDLFRFYCAKVGARCANRFGEPIAGPLFATDAAVEAFFARALAFVERTQDVTRAVHEETFESDTAPIGALPFLGRVAATCERNLQPPGLVTPDAPRSVLRDCNLLIVGRTVNGADPDAAFSPRRVQLVPDADEREALLRSLGVKHAVSRPLAVRARNVGSLDVEATQVRLFNGDGVDPEEYDAFLPGHPVEHLAAGEARVLEDEAVAGEEEPQPIWPLVFDLRGESAPPPRALGFAIDSVRELLERDRTDNWTGFFHRRLDAPAPAGQPVAAIDTDPDLLCGIGPSRLEAEVGIQGTGGPASLSGVTQAAVAPYQAVLLTYLVRNLGDRPLEQVIVERDGEPVLRVARLAPGAIEEVAVPFTPTQAGRLFLRVSARGIERENGAARGLRSAPAYATLDVVPGLETFRVALFDASPLADTTHPFSRFDATHDPNGNEIPIVGAVTDGDADLGGGRIRAEVAELDPNRPVVVSLADGEIAGATEDLGEVFVLDEGGAVAARGQELAGLAAPAGRLTVYYAPPAVFVREARRADDFPKAERSVQLLVRQDGVGSTARSIRLRRPPVFLLHGFLGNREIWNDLQPLVPRDSIPVERWQAFPGFDGRFDLVAVGSTLARANLARLTDLLETDVALALRRWRPGFAIGRFDAVGFSTGAPLWLRLVQKLVADGRAPPSPIRKLIPFSGAIDGTDLATKLVEVRDELQPLKLDLEWVDPLREGFRGGLTGTLQQKLKPDFCAITVKVLGLHEEFLLRGAVDDLRLGSPALPDPTALFASFARPPGLHFLADANTSNLFGVHTSSNEWGLTNPVVQMWALLGQLCNLTPDESTAETTQLQKDVVGILGVVAGPLRKALAKQGDARLEALAKTLTKVAKSGLKQALEAELPKPVFTGASAVNDRVLPERSQRHAHAANEAFVTSVGADAVDHLQFRSSPRTLADSCLVPLEPRFRTAIDDYNLDDSPDVVCFLLHLLEADPRTPLFLGGGP